MPRAVFSAIVHDRPGLVSEISAELAELGLNIEDSRMAALSGEFSVLMSIEGSDDALGELETRLEKRADGDFAYLFRRASEREAQPPTRAYRARLVAIDHPGIVAGIARFFSDRHINIRDLTTSSTPAPHTGTPIFTITLIADIPAGEKIHALRDQFEALCEEQDLDGVLEPAS